MTTYTVGNIRVLFPSDKVAEKRPDLFAVVTGEFRDAKGNLLSITRKEVTIEMAKSPEFALDTETGTFSIPSGKRGRKPSAGASQTEIAKRIAALKK